MKSIYIHEAGKCLFNLSIGGIGCIVQIIEICDLFHSCKYQFILGHVYKTMFSQAPFMFESFVAIIALESLLLVVGYFVSLQFTC